MVKTLRRPWCLLLWQRWFTILSSTFLRLQRQVPTIQNIQKTVEFP